jgi:hypothetical protein
MPKHGLLENPPRIFPIESSIYCGDFPAIFDETGEYIP